VVFCDLRGFTAFAEAAEPEEVMKILGDYHAGVGAIIHKYQGTIEHFAGDGLMAILNDPLPCPDPCVQAVRMAVEMRTVVGDLTSKWNKYGFDLGFGVGIAHGYATLGRIGFEGRFDYAAIGAVTNLASRLCDEAKDSQILIDGKVCAAVEGIAELEPLQDLKLKGFHRPIKAANVRAISAQEGRKIPNP
jgi:class 3 adenylate cyclase